MPERFPSAFSRCLIAFRFQQASNFTTILLRYSICFPHGFLWVADDHDDHDDDDDDDHDDDDDDDDDDHDDEDDGDNLDDDDYDDNDHDDDDDDDDHDDDDHDDDDVMMRIACQYSQHS